MDGKERRSLIQGSIPTIFEIQTTSNAPCLTKVISDSKQQATSATTIFKPPYSATAASATQIEAEIHTGTSTVVTLQPRVISDIVSETNLTTRETLLSDGNQTTKQRSFRSIGIQVESQSETTMCVNCGPISTSSPSVVKRDHLYPVCFVDPRKRKEMGLQSTPIARRKELLPVTTTPVRNLSPISTGSCFSPQFSSMSRADESLSLYEPSCTMEESCEEISGENLSEVLPGNIERSSAENIVKECKYLVFENNLDDLIKYSIFREIGCENPIDQSTILKSTTQGSQLTVSFSCVVGHENKWRSQPMVGKMPSGNLLLASAILLTGDSFHRVSALLEFIGMKGISKTTYYTIQQSLVIPEINLAWETEQNHVFSELKETQAVNLSCDGRCDSPGHSAKFCTCTLMEQEENKVVCFSLIQKSEVDFKSTNMELEGVKRCLKQLADQNIVLSQITTDRHIQVRAYLKNHWPLVDHQFDVWHLAKALRKKLMAKSIIKKNNDLLPWVKAIVRHLWYCSEKCKGDREKLVEMWQCMTSHIVNVHEFPTNKHTQICEHGPLTEEQVERRKWLTPNSDAHNALKSVVTETRFTKDLKQINNYSHTSALESYHNLVNKYCSKQKDYVFEVMEARTQLAALDHNFNSGRKTFLELNANADECSDRTQREEFEYYYSKATGEWHARPLKEPKTYTYIFDILTKIVQRQLDGQSKSRVMPVNRANIAPIPRPEKELLIIAAKKRKLF